MVCGFGLSKYLGMVVVTDVWSGTCVVSAIKVGAVGTSLFLGCLDGMVVDALAFGDCVMSFRFDEVDDGGWLGRWLG